MYDEHFLQKIKKETFGQNFNVNGFYSKHGINLLKNEKELMFSKKIMKMSDLKEMLYIHFNTKEMVMFLEEWLDSGLSLKEATKLSLMIIEDNFEKHKESTDYDIIELLEKIYFIELRENINSKLSNDFIKIKRDNHILIEDIKRNSFNVTSKNNNFEDKVFFQGSDIFKSIRDYVNTSYKNTLDLKDLNSNNNPKSFIDQKIFQSNMEKYKTTQIKRMYFLATMKTGAYNTNKMFNDLIIKKNVDNYEYKLANDLIKKSDLFCLDICEELDLNVDFKNKIQTYIAHAIYSYMHTKTPALSIIYIYLFLHTINLECTKERNIKIDVGLNVIFKVLKNTNAKEKEILFSFLTKDYFGFDLRNTILHSIGFDKEITEMFCLYFFSLFDQNYKTEKHYKSIYLLDDIKRNEKNNDNIEQILIKDENDISLFLYNMTKFESQLFLLVENPFNVKEVKLMFKGFGELKASFVNTPFYIKNKEKFSKLFELTKMKCNPNHDELMILRNFLLHYSNENIFTDKIKLRTKEFNSFYKEMSILIEYEILRRKEEKNN